MHIRVMRGKYRYIAESRVIKGRPRVKEWNGCRGCCHASLTQSLESLYGRAGIVWESLHEYIHGCLVVQIMLSSALALSGHLISHNVKEVGK